MTDNEFTSIAASLRSLALRVALSYRKNGGLDTAEAEDIAQDTMLRLWNRREQLPQTEARAMAVTVARHLAIDRLRRKATAPSPLLDTDIADRGAIPGQELEDKQNEQWLRERIGRLPAKEYMVLHMRQVEHKSNEEIATIIGINPQSVPVLLSRARHKLLDALKNKENKERRPL